MLIRTQAVLDDPSVSFWLKIAIRQSLQRDIVDAVNDAELLALTLKRELRVIQGGAQ